MSSGQERHDRVVAYVRERVAQECAVRGETQRLAEATGLSHTTLYRIQERVPTHAVLQALAQYWGLTLGVLESLAMGESDAESRPAAPAPRRETHPNLRATVEWLTGQMYPPEYLTEYEKEARRKYRDLPKEAWYENIKNGFFTWNEVHSKRPRASREHSGVNPIEKSAPGTQRPTSRRKSG